MTNIITVQLITKLLVKFIYKQKLTYLNLVFQLILKSEGDVRRVKGTGNLCLFVVIKYWVVASELCIRFEIKQCFLNKVSFDVLMVINRSH